MLRDLALSYGDRAIFENLNLCFEKGKSYLITGTSGCGKSSLLKMVAGEMAPSAGEISVFGSRPESYPLVSYVSQDTYIFEDTVRDNKTVLFVSHDVSDDFRKLFDGIIDLSGEA